jgi:hypothetical protein
MQASKKMSDLESEEAKIRKLFEEAYHLKEAARKSTNNLDPYLRAAQRLGRAKETCQ